MTCHSGVRSNVGGMDGTVKQVAGRVGLPERTVRYYDRIKLVSSQRRSSAGYRIYGPQEEGKLRFVREAKSLGLSLDEIRTLIAAAERGCCGEVVPELDRLLATKVGEVEARLTAMAEFLDRLKAFRTGHGASCGCDGHGAFCGCLNGASEQVESPVREEGTFVMNENSELPVVGGCGCGCGDDGVGCGCGCDGSCGCGVTAVATPAGEEIARLNQAKRTIDQRIVELQGS